MYELSVNWNGMGKHFWIDEVDVPNVSIIIDSSQLLFYSFHYNTYLSIPLPT